MKTISFDVRTGSREQMLDITSHVARAVEDSQIGDGTVTVYVPHTTAGVTVNENADPDVSRDILSALEHAVPWRQSFYRHAEGNTAAHVKSSLVGCSTVLPLVGGRMALGTWQAIFFCEFDGPRTRKVVVAVSGG